MKILPVGSRFCPTDLGLVRLYLRNKVERNQSSFITTMDIHQDYPWLLPHVNNPLFNNNEWYYFVPLTERGGKILSVHRKVAARGGSEGGTWRSNDGKKEIKDGHMQKGDGLRAVFHSDDLQKVVLCRIRYKKEANVNEFGLVNHQAHQTQLEMMLEGQEDREQKEEADLTGFADSLETMLEGQEDHEQPEDADLTGFADSLETMLEGHEDREQPEEAELTGFANDDLETMMLDGE
ncbi:unnamed protein product [Arabidopsis thaliana]|uniref:NAC domain-containing protein n=1 Tax=Arabidopsis thaliana TaxID=3702 RepID=A0A654E7H9_ARATH|nr:unnamed protein product [Arabidopsis thaliana]VYS44884.1 unnamed protein product [Arabidopsis thaliana]